jgi:hypothetical protein
MEEKISVLTLLLWLGGKEENVLQEEDFQLGREDELWWGTWGFGSLPKKAPRAQFLQGSHNATNGRDRPATGAALWGFSSFFTGQSLYSKTST